MYFLNWFQIVAGVILILDHRIKVNTKKDLKAVTRYTTAIQMITFSIIILNILIVAFAEPTPVLPPTKPG